MDLKKYIVDINNSSIFNGEKGFFDSPFWTTIDGLFTSISLVLLVYGAFKLLNWVNAIRLWYRKDTQGLIIICGLGENNRTYIDSELESGHKNLIVIEKNKNNLYLDMYKKKGVGVLIGDATSEEVLNKFNLKSDKNIIVVSVGDDMTNLEIVAKVLENKNIKARIYVHIEDRNLRYFQKDGGLLQDANIKVFSYYEDASRALFEHYDIDGKTNDIILSCEAYSIAIVGNTNLAYEVISQACIMGQLPNENKLTIYCIDKNPNEFKQSVDLNYPEINNVPNVELKYIELDCNSKEFYTKDLWYEKNLTNIILCFTDEQLNLDIAANILNITYLESIVDKTLKTEVLIAMFNDYNFSHKLTLNVDMFQNFYVFGQRNEICNKKYLIDEQRDKKAIATNEIYNQSVSKEKQKTWKERSYHEKESNRASADHIKIKQKYLNIEAIEKGKELLAKCEHNRWNAHHFLNGWKYNELTIKEKKFHNCLIPYSELTEDIKEYDREMVKNIEKIIKISIDIGGSV